MSSNRIDWWRPLMAGREKELLCEVVDSGFPNDGEYTAAFERKIAELVDTPYAVGVTSGTAAIFLALVACGIRPGDEVLVPDITFIATAHAVKLAGAIPVLVDVERKRFCLDARRIEGKLTRRTRAIVPVHVSGRGADMTAIDSVARQHSLQIVEDAADALGSRLPQGAIGSLGNAGCFSFTATKLITTGQGGMVVTRDPAIFRRLLELKDQGRRQRGTGGDDLHLALGYNFKLSNLQSAMGLAQLETFPARMQHQCAIYQMYRDLLSRSRKIQLAEFDLTAGERPLWIDALVDGRDELHDYLKRRNIYTRKYWHPLHTQPVFKTDDVCFCNSLEISRKGLWLPSSPTLTQEEVQSVCEAINAWEALQ